MGKQKHLLHRAGSSFGIILSLVGIILLVSCGNGGEDEMQHLQQSLPHLYQPKFRSLPLHRSPPFSRSYLVTPMLVLHLERLLSLVRPQK